MLLSAKQADRIFRLLQAWKEEGKSLVLDGTVTLVEHPALAVTRLYLEKYESLDQADRELIRQALKMNLTPIVTTEGK